MPKKHHFLFRSTLFFSSTITQELIKILSVLVNYCTILICNQDYYDCLEIDEFWTFVGKKSNKVRLIYVSHREPGDHEVAPKVDCSLDVWKKKCKNRTKITQNNETKGYK